MLRIFLSYFAYLQHYTACSGTEQHQLPPGLHTGLLSPSRGTEKKMALLILSKLFFFSLHNHFTAAFLRALPPSLHAGFVPSQGSVHHRPIMWPKIWLRCALWLSCAKQRYWRTCDQGPYWDHMYWCPQPYQEIHQTGCPCEAVPHDLRGSERPGNQTSHWQSGGGVSYRESLCRRAPRSLEQETLHCCHQARRGSESETLTEKCR